MLWNRLFEIGRCRRPVNGGRRLRQVLVRGTALWAVELRCKFLVLNVQGAKLVFQRCRAGAVVGVSEAGLLGLDGLDALLKGFEGAGNLAILRIGF